MGHVVARRRRRRGDGMDYLWLKALHIVSIIAWMVGLLYLPRLFVYHASVGGDAGASATFKVMERRLLRGIMLPAMIASWVFGVWLIFELDAWREGWVHAKLALVVCLSAMHGVMARWRRDFAEDRNRHSATFYRVINEVPTLLMIGIVLFVVLKPSFR
jgi:putative membrane protein